MAQAAPQNVPNLVRYQNEQLARLRDKLAEAMTTGGIDAVHDLRVASRRLHGAIEVARLEMGRKRVKRAQRSLKRIRQAFREIRDLDVLRLSLSESPGTGVLEPGTLAELETVLSERRDQAMTATTGDKQQTKLLKRLAPAAKLIADFAPYAEREPTVIEEHLKDMLQRRASALLAQDPGEPSKNLHQTRICVKKTRYCAQLMSECGCLEAGDLLARLSEMQTLLGHWNDQIVASGTLARMAGQWEWLVGRAAISANLLEYAAQRARMSDDDRAKVVEQWSSFVELVRTSVPGLAEGEATAEPAVEVSSSDDGSAEGGG